MPIPATTDAEALVNAASAGTPKRMTVVFTTYQSMRVIADAHKLGLPAFDLVVCDEAHRTTGALRGDDSSSFLLVHDEQEVRARKRLYMTATPRIYSETAQLKAKEEDIYVASMDNEQQYGPEFHRLGFAEALDTLDERGEPLLSDYKVTILVMGEKQIARDSQRLLAEGEALADVGRVIGCLNGLAKIDPEGVSSRTTQSRCIAQWRSQTQLPPRNASSNWFSENRTKQPSLRGTSLSRGGMWTARLA